MVTKRLKGSRLVAIVGLACAGALAPVAAANDEPVVITRSFEQTGFAGHLRVKQTGDWPLDVVPSSDDLNSGFAPTPSGAPSFGFSHAAHWIAFDINNRDNPDSVFYLELAHPVLDHVSLFSIDAAGYVNERRTGDHYPFSQRDVSYRDFIFKLEIPPGTTRHFTVAIRSTSSISAPLTLWQRQAFEDKRSPEQMLLGLYYGAILGLILYNAFIYFSTRDQGFILYAIFDALLLLAFMASNGLAFQYLWPSSTYWPNVAPTIGSCSAAVLMNLFVRNFLGLQKTRRGQILLIFATIDAVWCALGLVLDPSISFPVAVAIMLPEIAFIVVISIRDWLRGSRDAAFFCVAWMPLIASCTAYLLTKFGVIGVNLMTIHGPAIGSVAETLVLSLGVGDRYSALKRTQVRDQRRVIAGLKTIEHLKIQLETLLEATKKMAAAPSSFEAARVAMSYAISSVPSFHKAGLAVYVAPGKDQGPIEGERWRGAEFVREGVLTSESAFATAAAPKMVEADPMVLEVAMTWGDTALGVVRVSGHNRETYEVAEQNFFQTLISSMALAITNLDHKGNLEELVRARTNELQGALRLVTEKATKIQKILDHIQQGIVTFDNSLSIDADFSHFFATLYQRQGGQIAGANVIDVAFSSSSLTSDEMAQARNVLSSAVGEMNMFWEINAHLLPTETTVKIDQTPRTIASEWIPFVSLDGMIERIMLSVRDLTAQRALEEKVKLNEQENVRLMNAISVLIQHDRPRVEAFLIETTERLALVQEAVASHSLSPKISRELHTIKGSCRLLGFRDVAEAVHDAETCLGHAANDDKDWPLFAAQVEKVSDQMAYYTRIFETYLSGKGSDGDTAGGWSLNYFAGSALPMVMKALADAGLGLVGYSCDDRVLAWSPGVARRLGPMLTHGLNNAVDHGYVLAKRKGKAVGPVSLTFAAAIESSKIVVRIVDRGAGIDLVALRSKGPLGADPFELLFDDGISTAGSLTLTSGRGVGLGAVRHEARELGGDVTIRNNSDGPGTTLEITLPLVSVQQAEPGLAV